ncbi:MAG: hypothetical protein ACR2MA_12360 [Egibacteraceae bacterium]
MLFILVFVVVLFTIDHLLRRRDRDGYWNPEWRSSASHPGVKILFSDDDGARQRPVPQSKR